MNPSELDNIARLEETFWWYRGMDDILAAQLAPHLRSPRTILDAGCGTGRAAAWLRRAYGCRVDGLDILPQGLRRAAARGLATLVQGDLRCLPFRSASYDAVVSLDTLVHLAPGDERPAFAEFLRVLKPGGVLAVRAAAFSFLRSRHSRSIDEKQRFRLSDLRRTGETAGLETISATYANALLLPIALVKFRILEPLSRSEPRSGVEPLPAPLNRALAAVLGLERSLLAAGLRFPAGQSVIWIARRSA